ncbi:MAG: AAA family ATPase, partial [Myxococcales bacterium]|nr:AAA family ATPase [Myxococcales bacterium]
MTRINLPETPTVAQRLQPRGGLAEGVHLLDHASIHAINAALIGNRPLLLRGSPGVGKSQLARAAADLLGRSLVNYTVTSRTETDDLLWQVDLVSRLAEAQLAGATGNADRVRLEHFVCPGPLWWGFDWGSAQTRWRSYRTHVAGEASAADPPDTPSGNGVVVLIDEIDKADLEFPNDLLHELDAMEFTIMETGESIAARQRPIVIITSNNEK